MLKHLIISALLVLTSLPIQADNTHTLPAQVQLSFDVFKGENNFQLGVSQHQLSIKQNHYELTASTQSTGIASMFKPYQLTQTSRGKISKGGLKPDKFEEHKVDGAKNINQSALFNWTKNELVLTDGSKPELIAGTQDAISFFYQLSQLALEQKTLQLAVTNGKKLEQYQFSVEKKETLDTPAGPLRTIKLSKVHAAGVEGTEIWLALDHQHLPVKIRQLDKSGDVSAEMRLTEIKVVKE